MEQPAKEAIVGIAFGYNDFRLHPFLSSLEKTGYKGDVVLFVNKKSKLSLQIPFKLSIKVINIDAQLSPGLYIYRLLNWLMRALHLTKFWVAWNKKRLIRSLHTKQKISRYQLTFVHSFFFLTISRFFIYYDWLLKSQYSRIFFTDVNDVIFQDNIFSSFVEDKIVVYEEYEGCCLGFDENNRGWVKAGYGEKILNEIAASPIFCAGTIMGSRTTNVIFLQDFIQEVIGLDKPVDVSGLDQGVLNYLVSHKKLHYFLPSKNGEAIFTAALQPENDIVIRDEKIGVKNATQPLAIVHQYNRHKKLLNFIQYKFFVADT